MLNDDSDRYLTQDVALMGWVVLFVIISFVFVATLYETHQHTHDDTGKAVWKATGDE